MGLYDLEASAGSAIVEEVTAEAEVPLIAAPEVVPEDEAAPEDISTIGLKKRNGKRSKNVWVKRSGRLGIEAVMGSR
jgi:hypothetical protein